MGGLDNCRQVRSNTYDDPQQISAASNGAAAVVVPVPTYETVQSAKMLNASGPPVLNPVYGPTGTPTSPISPCPISPCPMPPPSKGATSSVPNPVYSETGSRTQLPIVSPVYAAIGKSTVALEPVQSDPVLRAQSNGSQNVGDSPRAPLYEELQTSIRVVPSQQPTDSMTTNESYGLLKMIETSPKTSKE